MALKLKSGAQTQAEAAAAGGEPDVAGSAAAHAQQRGYNTGGWRVMQEGTITYQNGVPGFMVKYIDSQGMSTTEWTPLQGGAEGLANVPMMENGQVTGPGGASSLLTSSPYYQQTLAAVNAAAAADAAARRGGVQQALIGFGEVPGTFKDKYGDIDTLTRSLADKNTKSGISSKARLLQARSDAIREYSRRLSSKGLRRSGAKGYGLRRRQLEFDQSYSDALGKLLGYTGGLYSQFAGNEYQRQLALAQALAYASQNLGDFGLGDGSPTGPARNPYVVQRDPDRAIGVGTSSPFDLFEGGGRAYGTAPSGYDVQRPGRISGVQEF